jgi:hypothetical protein
MEACVGPTGAAFLHWLAPIIASFFPWPALIAMVLLLTPFRSSLSSFAAGFADLPRAVTAIKMAGMKINIDPTKAKELDPVVQPKDWDFDRMVDRGKAEGWSKFEAVTRRCSPMLTRPL